MFRPSTGAGKLAVGTEVPGDLRAIILLPPQTPMREKVPPIQKTTLTALFRP
jgi:hypothetical protein